MKIYKLTNKSNNSILMVAPTAFCATTLAMKCNFARSITNIEVENITEDYQKWHSAQGFDLSKLNAGQLCKVLNGSTSEWFTTSCEDKT